MTTRTITVASDSPSNFHNGDVRPLTTIFTQPSGCAFPIQYTDVSAAGSSRNCAPPDFAQVWNFGFYSPAICPSGYTIGCSYSNNLGSPWSITPGETAALCVPKSWICSDNPDWARPPLVGGGDAGLVPAIKIRWQSSDLSLLTQAASTTSTASTSSSSSSSSSPSPTPTQGPTTTPNPTSSSTELSSVASARPTNTKNAGSHVSVGAKAGMGIGIALAVVLLASALVWIWRRRTRHAAARAAPEADNNHHLDGNPISELEGKRKVQENTYHPSGEFPPKQGAREEEIYGPDRRGPGPGMVELGGNDTAELEGNAVGETPPGQNPGMGRTGYQAR